MTVKRGAAEKAAFGILALFFLALFGFPFAVTLSMSFKSMPDYMSGNFWGLPRQVFLGNFRSVLFSGFNRYFINSVFVSAPAVTLTLLFASLAGYALAKMRFRAAPFVFTLFIIGMMIPVHATLIPVYRITLAMGLTDNLAGLVGPYIGIGLPVAVFITTGFFREIPGSIQESAFMDGASPFRIFRSIMLPLSIPAVSTVGILNLLTYWNEFMYAFTLISARDRRTLPLGIRDFHSVETVNVPGVFAAILIASIPVIVFYIAAQEKVISGLSSGAVKG